jgi:spore germination cell wall hydrolase CwlJ-like protein
VLDRFHRLLNGIQARFPRLPGRDAAHLVAVEFGLVAALTASLALAGVPDQKDPHRLTRLTAGDFSAQAFARLTHSMDPSMLRLAGRIDGRLSPAAYLRGSVESADPVAATVTAETPEPAVLRLQDLTPDQARAWNAANPIAVGANPAALPFKLKTGGMLDEARAVDCLTAAIYYEAAWETLDGQRAVAQVVLNRMRHPAFPKTVCGVVFQGSNKTTGCQFSFTCDGAMGRAPNEAAWSRARQVAEAALDGYVMRKVGNATHYHANYVAPYWSPTLLKVTTIGAHIFYRWTGGWGRPGAFDGRYAGTELEGMQIAALDKYSTGPVVETPASKDAIPEVLPVENASPAHAPRVAANAGAEGKPAAGVAEDADSQNPVIITPAQAAKGAETMVKAEDLDWMGRPKPKGPPRVAAPSKLF